MAQPIDPDIRSKQRSESPAGTVLKRLFAFWRQDDDLAPEVAPELSSNQAKEAAPRSAAFTIWTAERYAKGSPTSRAAETDPLSLPPSRAFTTWTSPAALEAQSARWKLPRIVLPSSRAFSAWTTAAALKAQSARWKLQRIVLPSSRAFSAWTTPAALGDLSARWAAPAPIELPPSRGFSLWSREPLLSSLASRWALAAAGAEPVTLTEPHPFTVWTEPGALDAMAGRWSASVQSPMITIKDPNPFSVWTELAKNFPDQLAAGAGATREASPAPPQAPIRLTESRAHSIWTSVEALAAAAARWIPQDATAKVAPLPAGFSSAASGADEGSGKSKITPFPDPGGRSEAETTFANKDNMESNKTNPIQLTKSNAFTIWSTPDSWKPNPISATSVSAPQPEVSDAGSAAAALADVPKEKPSAEASHAPAPRETVGAGDGGGENWKWAFVLTLIAALGIFASQRAAIGKVEGEKNREIASREKVAKEKADLAKALADESAAAQALAAGKAELETTLKKEISELSGTIEAQKEELVANASQLEGMEGAVGKLRLENEAASKQIAEFKALADQKEKLLKDAAAALTKKLEEFDAEKLRAATLDSQAKELGAQLKMTTADKQAVSAELAASSQALSVAKATAAELATEIADLKAKIAELEQPAAAPATQPEPTPPSE